MEQKIQTQRGTIADGYTTARAAVLVLLKHKALDVRLHTVIGKTDVTDYYVNATARSSTHVLSLADEVARELTARGITPLHVEGKGGKSWLLVDYGDVIVNIFDRQTRDFYAFDRLLPADTQTDITDLVREADAAFALEDNK